MKKKSYNPFKMMSVWYGALFGFVFGIYSYTNYSFDIYDIILKIFGSINPLIYGYYQAGIIHAILFFLIIWGINSLWRKYR